MRQYYVYIMASLSRTLYTGMSNDLRRRVHQHRNGLVSGFTSRYNVARLVYAEAFEDVRDAVAREKQIKGWLRSKKMALVESVNPEWEDLSEAWFPAEQDPSLRSG
jgi:putative endonuclease